MKDSSGNTNNLTPQALIERIEALEKEIERIKIRNRKVEGDKAWETSRARHVMVAAITYVFATVVLWLIKVEDPYLAALIPTLGYVLSTLTIGHGKRYWIKRFFPG